MIHEEYVKENKMEEKSKEEIDKELIKSIINAKKELKNASNNYEYADGELIDYYLYQIKASQSKLNYLLKKAKKNGLIVDRIDEIAIKYIEDTKVV